MHIYACINAYLYIYIYIYTRIHTYVLLHLSKVEVRSFGMPNMQIFVVRDKYIEHVHT